MQGNRASEGADRPLAGGIGDVGNPEIAQARDRADVDDGPAAAFQHGRDGILASQMHGAEVDRHLPIPGCLAQLDRAADLEDADVVVQQVETPKGLDTARDRGGHRRTIGDVGLKGLGLTALLTDDGGGLLGRLGRQVDAEDPRALAREERRRRLAVAPARAAGARAHHQRHLARQSPGHRALPCRRRPIIGEHVEGGNPAAAYPARRLHGRTAHATSARRSPLPAWRNW